MSDRPDGGQAGGADREQEEEQTDQRAQETLRKYDQESSYRTNLGHWKWIVWTLGAALTIFHLYTGWRGTYPSIIQGSFHLGTGMALIYLLYPARKAWSNRPGIPIYDVALAAAVLAANYYIIVNYGRLSNQAMIFGFTNLDYLMAVIGVVLLLEATRRCVGIPIVVIALLALAYTLGVSCGDYHPSKSAKESRGRPSCPLSQIQKLCNATLAAKRALTPSNSWGLSRWRPKVLRSLS